RFSRDWSSDVCSSDLEFPLYKEQIILRYSEIKTYLMLPHQRTLYQRINSGLNDRNSWLSSLVQGLIGKNLESITDAEEEIIHERSEERRVGKECRSRE